MTFVQKNDTNKKLLHQPADGCTVSLIVKNDSVTQHKDYGTLQELLQAHYKRTEQTFSGQDKKSTPVQLRNWFMDASKKLRCTTTLHFDGTITRQMMVPTYLRKYFCLYWLSH